MSKQKMTALIVAVVVVGAAAAAVAFVPKKQMNNQQRPNAQTTTTTQQAPAQTTSQGTTSTDTKAITDSKTATKTETPDTSYTAAQVATHNNEQSCWTIVRGNVFDVTKWISQHPGGSKAILGLCGKDGTALFEGQHDGQKQQESTLASFKIGTLQK